MRAHLHCRRVILRAGDVGGGQWEAVGEQSALRYLCKCLCVVSVFCVREFLP